MTDKSQKQLSLKLTQARKALAKARTTDDLRKISVAVANLGLALFQVNKFSEGARSFNEVDKIFEDLDDFYLQVHCLGIKTMAYQLSEQYPQAFQAAQEIEALAVKQEALAVQSDALATQGQILIDSGEEVYALEKFNAALTIAENLADKRRRMNVTGALGNYCMTIASPAQAESYFAKARELARELGDRQSEIGFHGNLGALLEWKEEYLQAGEVFEEVVAYMRETDNQEAEIQALRHMVQVCIKLKDDEKIAYFAQQGVAAAREADRETLFFFCDNLIAAHYRLNQFDAAHEATVAAIEIARSTNDHKREVDLQISLGESYMLTNNLEKALVSYQQALKGTRRYQRLVDQAYLLGRMGIILAELNQTDEAVRYHEQALAMAQRHELPDLAGEQLVMLAMAHLENKQLEKARAYGETAVTAYTNANLTENAEKAQKLLTAIAANEKNHDENQK